MPRPSTSRAIALVELIVQAEEVFYEAQRALREGAFDARYPVLEKSAEEMLRDMTEGLDLWLHARTPATVAPAGGVRQSQRDQQDAGIAAMEQVSDAIPPAEQPIRDERMAPPSGPVPVEQKELLEGCPPRTMPRCPSGPRTAWWPPRRRCLFGRRQRMWRHCTRPWPR